MKNTVNTLLIRFTNEIRHSELPLFRGAVLHSMIDDVDVLFHNHKDGGKYRYKYPLIQYKRINGKAALMCMGDGTEAVGQLFSLGDKFLFNIGTREEKYEIESINAARKIIQAWDGGFRYSIKKWLPLNSANYEKYQGQENARLKKEYLEHIMVGNILSLCSGLNIYIERKIECRILGEPMERIYKFKNVMMMGFDVDVVMNVSLPNYCGIGKGVSLGFGMVKQIKDEKE